ncbi:MAG: ATP-binding cassette domain-containing protein [Thermoleophilia bacterium]|nr:ATP-binding cassette domain-containing protein [Thermoleophilia bacterium]
MEVEGLEKTYPKGVRALDGLGFAVSEGEVYGLLGPNGAGKSTTVKILATLSTPDAGTARVAGYDVAREASAVRRSIGYVPQASGVDVHATGRENLLLQGRVQRVPPAELRRRMDELLVTFGLAEFADRIVRTYSGGMKRRLDEAMGLVHRPVVLFLDEPTTGLDPEARAAMWEELERLAGEERLTILLTTHYLEEADRLAKRVAIVSRGRVAVEGSPDGLKRRLSGDAVTVELAGGDVAAAAVVVERLGAVEETVVDGRHLRARVEHGAQAVPGILSALEANGIAVASVTVARPSLDDVYLHVTGRDFRAEDAAGGAS